MSSENMKLALELKKAIRAKLVAKEGKANMAQRLFNELMRDFAPDNEEEERDLCSVYVNGAAKFSGIALYSHLMSHDNAEPCVGHNYTAIINAFSAAIIENLDILCKESNIENPLNPAMSEVNKKLVEELITSLKKGKD